MNNEFRQLSNWEKCNWYKMSKTFLTSIESPTQTSKFIPKESLTSKDDFGISRTVYTHVSNLHRLLSDWIRIRDRGTKICRTISSLKLYEYTDGYYPTTLKPLTESLVDALDGLLHVVEGVETIDRQLQALAKLQSCTEPVITTWSVTQIAESASKLYKDLLKEYRLKEIVTENIAHCRDENLIEVYVSSWEFDPNLDYQSNTSYLFAEVGLSSIT